jgi:Fe-Mn family superoxide dismutase
MLSRVSARFASSGLKAALPSLAYGYGDLEPAISGRIMEIHHSKHHQAYVTNYNLALEKAEAALGSSIGDGLALHNALRFNGGGHLNHTLFWENLAPVRLGGGDASAAPTLAKAVAHLGGIEGVKAKMSAAGVAVQGSGWAWLAYDAAHDTVVVTSTANQDPVLGPLHPLLAIDVWEHAYYLQYANVRPDYLKNIWAVVNWAAAENRLIKATKK